MWVTSSISSLRSFTKIAPVGQTSTHLAQPMQRLSAIGFSNAGAIFTALPLPLAARLCTVCTFAQTSTQRLHLMHLFGLRTMTLLSSTGY